jgi:hypothetical protein
MVELSHTAALPPDLNVTYPTPTEDSNIFQNQTLDVVCVPCISSGDKILTVNTNIVAEKYRALKTKVEIEVSWPHAFCGKQVYQLVFTPDLMGLNVTDSRGEQVKKSMANTNHPEVPTVVPTSKTSAHMFNELLLVTMMLMGWCLKACN